MIIINYIIGASTLLVGTISLLRIFGIIKSSKKLDAMRDKLGNKTGIILFVISYVISPIAISIILFVMAIKGIAFL